MSNDLFTDSSDHPRHWVSGGLGDNHMQGRRTSVELLTGDALRGFHIADDRQARYRPTSPIALLLFV